MGSFDRAPLGYDREQVDSRIAEMEQELAALAEMVAERERELGAAREELREIQEVRNRNATTIESVGQQLEEIQAQARGQATRIRMKALREAAEIGERITELAKRTGLDPRLLLEFRRQSAEVLEPVATEVRAAEPSADGNAVQEAGDVEVVVGPLRDFAQLTAFEDACLGLAAVDTVAIERFSEARATLVLSLSRATDLVAELAQATPFELTLQESGATRIVFEVADGYAAAA
ncbi:MAG: DivIVA protein [Solirubrobacterales bacterium]|nr:DivIVA protein [Solirubrobacterales bacterium]